MKKLKKLNEIAVELAYSNGAQTESEAKKMAMNFRMIDVVDFAKKKGALYDLRNHQ